MKLTSRVLLLMVCLLALALAGSLVIHTWAARQALFEQLELRNRDAAVALGLALSQQQGDEASLKAVAAAQFDTGSYSLVRLTRSDGGPALELQRADPAVAAPAWFVSALPMAVPAGQAVVTHGWKQLGTLQVAAQSAWAYTALWDACRNTAALLAGLGLLGALLAVVALRAWQRPLRATVNQARALENGRFVEADEPGLPELKTLTRTMNSMVRRVRTLLTQQATQLAELQQEALHDAGTGLLQRRYFLARLSALRATATTDAAQRLLASVVKAQKGKPAQSTQQAKRALRAAQSPSVTAPLENDETQLMERPGDQSADTQPMPLPGSPVPAASGPGLALVLLRVQELDALNLRLGRETVDRLLTTIAHALEPYVDRVEGCFAGRLNGSDFALCLPVAGVAEETARSLHEALAAAPALTSAAAQVAVGAVDVLPNVGSSQAMALADEALARAESATGWFVVDAGRQASSLSAADSPSSAAAFSPLGSAMGRGSQVWRSQIAQALAENRAELAEFVVLDRHQQVLHLECPLRVQLFAGEAYQPAGRWLALARRSRLMPQVDLKALELALKAISGDQRARSIHVSWPSLAAPGFAGEVTRRLRQAPAASRLLSIEWGQSARPHDWVNLAMATQGWRDLGVKIGARHALAQPQQLVSLQELGIDHVKVDPQHLLGVAADEGVATYVKALVRLIHGLGAKAFAGGVVDEQDLRALWTCGFDAATGPAVTAVWTARRAPTAGSAGTAVSGPSAAGQAAVKMPVSSP